MVAPEDRDRLVDTEVYYSYDPNCRTRFWIRAEAQENNGVWSADMAKRENLPLYVMTLCRYRLPAEEEVQHGKTTTFVLNSLEHVVMPDELDLEKLRTTREQVSIVEDFQTGLSDWSSRHPTSIKTYKFQSPTLDRSSNKRLRVRLDPQGKKIGIILSTGSRFLPRSHAQDDFRLVKVVDGDGVQEILIPREEFQGKEGETLQWDRIALFSVTLKDMDANQHLDLLEGEGSTMLKELALVD